MMNHFTEGNNRSYNFIAPLGAGLFYTHTHICVLAANIYFTGRDW